MTGMMASGLDDIEHRFARVLYYGKPGTGKSTNIASMGNRGLTFIVDMEDGYEADALKERGINTSNLKIFRPRSYDEIEQCYWEIKGTIDSGMEVYGVGLDHWGEIQDILVRDEAIRRIEKKKRELTKLAATDTNARAELNTLTAFKTELPDYGVWTDQGKKLLRLYRDLPVHVAFAAHETLDENTGKLVPANTDKFEKRLRAGVRTVVYTRATEVKGEGRIEFAGVTKPVDRFEGKDRTGKLPTVLINPSMDRIIDLFDDKMDIDNDPAQAAWVTRKNATK